MEYILIFLEGIASFISPCVLPLVPIYISYFAGQDPKKNKAITNSIAFVIGYSIVFAILAVLANRFGMVLVGLTKTIKIASRRSPSKRPRTRRADASAGCRGPASCRASRDRRPESRGSASSSRPPTGGAESGAPS